MKGQIFQINPTYSGGDHLCVVKALVVESAADNFLLQQDSFLEDTIATKVVHSVFD